MKKLTVLVLLTLTQLRDQVDTVITKLIGTFEHNVSNNVTITEFSITNPAQKPTQPDDTLFFTDTYTTQLISKVCQTKHPLGSTTRLYYPL